MDTKISDLPVKGGISSTQPAKVAVHGGRTDSDFLSKIEQQLESSRKQFPS